MIPSADLYEKLGAFYLGRGWDVEAKEPTDDIVLYDSRDLTTHAVCVGMTGSGKTGLCVGLLEEAAIDGIPALVIDPKGDLTNLALTFPELRPEDFRPWINEDDAARAGVSPQEYAAAQARTWNDGLQQWGQSGERIRRLREAAEIAVYTPGSTAGRPLSVLSSLAAPPAAVRADADSLREQVTSAIAGLLALLGIDADPVRSREQILLSTVLQAAWAEGRDLDLATLIGAIQNPPVQRVGVIDMESFFPAAERFALAMSLNNLLASPGFAAWLQGEPLDVDALLYDASGRPKIAIVYIAHLSDRERMFVVTALLNAMVAWMRSRPGTSSLRALVYMDEVFGYMPPVAEPPSKRPLLTLMKQARAFGVGVVLATQNPVDLDYKGLSNAGTWFLGRLQTERDKQRVLDGLEGAAAAGAFDRSRLDVMLSQLGKRVFLLHSVHEASPRVFQTRWALSYLRGPLTREQIRQLPQAAAPAGAGAADEPTAPTIGAPLLPPDVPQGWLPLRRPASGPVIYRPELAASVQITYADGRRGLEAREALTIRLPLSNDLADWSVAAIDESSLEPWSSAPVPGDYAALPAAASQARQYGQWQRQLAGWLYRERRLELFRSPTVGEVSRPGESERDFRIRIADRAHELRDAAVDELRDRYAAKLASAQERVRKAAAAVSREQEQARGATLQTAISIGSTLLSAVLGSRRVSTTTIGKATTAARGAGRAVGQAQDVARARQNVEAYRDRLQELEQSLEGEILELTERFDPARAPMDTITLKPRKSDVAVLGLRLLWVPHEQDASGELRPLA